MKKKKIEILTIENTLEMMKNIFDENSFQQDIIIKCFKVNFSLKPKKMKRDFYITYDKKLYKGLQYIFNFVKEFNEINNNYDKNMFIKNIEENKEDQKKNNLKNELNCYEIIYVPKPETEKNAENEIDSEEENYKKILHEYNQDIIVIFNENLQKWRPLLEKLKITNLIDNDSYISLVDKLDDIHKLEFVFTETLKNSITNKMLDNENSHNTLEKIILKNEPCKKYLNNLTKGFERLKAILDEVCNAISYSNTNSVCDFWLAQYGSTENGFL